MSEQPEPAWRDSLALESGQSGEAPTNPGSSDQHWVFVVYWAPEVESSRCRADAALVCLCVYHSHDEVSCIPRSITAPNAMGQAFLEKP